jgi:hypothetical protein
VYPTFWNDGIIDCPTINFDTISVQNSGNLTSDSVLDLSGDTASTAFTFVKGAVIEYNINIGSGSGVIIFEDSFSIPSLVFLDYNYYYFRTLGNLTIGYYETNKYCDVSFTGLAENIGISFGFYNSSTSRYAYFTDIPVEFTGYTYFHGYQTYFKNTTVTFTENSRSEFSDYWNVEGAASIYLQGISTITGGTWYLNAKDAFIFNQGKLYITGIWYLDEGATFDTTGYFFSVGDMEIHERVYWEAPVGICSGSKITLVEDTYDYYFDSYITLYSSTSILALEGFFDLVVPDNWLGFDSEYIIYKYYSSAVIQDLDETDEFFPYSYASDIIPNTHKTSGCLQGDYFYVYDDLTGETCEDLPLVDPDISLCNDFSSIMPEATNPGDVDPPTVKPPTVVTPTVVTPTVVTPTVVTPTDVTPTDVTPTDVTPTDVTPTDVTPTDVTPTDVTPTVPTVPSTAGKISIQLVMSLIISCFLLMF